MEFKDVFDTISTPGDAAAFLLGFAGGFAVDAFLFLGGVPPGTVGIVSGSATLGAKKALDADRQRRREAAVSDVQRARLQKTIEWIRGLHELPESLRTDLDFYVSGWAAGGIDDATLQKRLAGIIEQYEARLHTVGIHPSDGR